MRRGEQIRPRRAPGASGVASPGRSCSLAVGGSAARGASGRWPSCRGRRPEGGGGVAARGAPPPWLQPAGSTAVRRAQVRSTAVGGGRLLEHAGGGRFDRAAAATRIEGGRQ